MKVFFVSPCNSLRVLLLLIVILQDAQQASAADQQQQCEMSSNGGNDSTDYMKKTKSTHPLYSPIDNTASEASRRMASIGQIMTNPNFNTIDDGDDEPIRLRRKNYPESNPHICLAFLSCCNRIDLLNHTISATIRHLEEDEPSELKYEIALVDNGSDNKLTQQMIINKYQIEHALMLPQNMGLAYGMNILIHNLCTAPYILLLEEDWLYLDELVAPQTTQRKSVIATSLALLEQFQKDDIRSYDSRQILGVFLRHETYDSFLKFPHADVWETKTISSNYNKTLPQVTSQLRSSLVEEEEQEAQDYDSSARMIDIDYRIFCADTGLQGDSIWGSYTNGAGLYRRDDLIHTIGRMYGEPGDPFHDRYVEGNYAYRVGLFYCHAAIRLTSDKSCINIADPNCCGAFHHIGSGRSTRPRTAQGTSCADPSWNFFGTPLYDKYHKMADMAAEANGKIREPMCTSEQLEEMRQIKFRDMDAKEYREQVAKDNAKVFEEELRERDKMRVQAKTILNLLEQGNVDVLKSQVPWMADMTTSEIRDSANRMLKLMDSPHPMQGFWDSHGRIINRNK